MTAEELLAYEARVKLRQALLASVAGLLLVVGVVTALAGPHANVNESTLGLIYIHKRLALDLVGAIANALGYGALALTLDFLFRAARARNPEMQPVIRYLTITGAALASITGVVYQIVVAIAAHKFVTHGTQTYQQANALTGGAGIPVASIVLQLGLLLLTCGCIWTSLNVMRVGLLTRMMGYCGVAVGIVIIFPLGFVAPFIQAAWLLALAYLLSGRWSSGVPPAWASGQAEPWPTGGGTRQDPRANADARAKRIAASKTKSEAKAEARANLRDRWNAVRGGGNAGAVVDSTASDVDDVDDTPDTPGPSPSTSAAKRKRKRRH